MKKLLMPLIFIGFCLIALLALKGMRSKAKAKAATPAPVSNLR